MATHTPGPWNIGLECRDSGWVDIEAPNCHMPIIGSARHQTFYVNKANARVMAAAPELLEALILMMAHAPYWIANNKNGETQIDRDVLTIASAAIAKATTQGGRTGEGR